MKVLVDSNIIIDNVLKRSPFSEEALDFFELLISGKISGYAAAMTYPNIMYILRNKLEDQELREYLLGLCTIIETVAIDHDMIVSALKWKDFKDFEDCIQAECAIVVGADYIVTRNAKDFKECNIKCVTAGEFCEIIRSQSEDAAT